MGNINLAKMLQAKILTVNHQWCALNLEHRTAHCHVAASTINESLLDSPMRPRCKHLNGLSLNVSVSELCDLSVYVLTSRSQEKNE